MNLSTYLYVVDILPRGKQEARPIVIPCFVMPHLFAEVNCSMPHQVGHRRRVQETLRLRYLREQRQRRDRGATRRRRYIRVDNATRGAPRG